MLAPPPIRQRVFPVTAALKGSSIELVVSFVLRLSAMTEKRDAVLRTMRSLREAPDAKEAAILIEQQIAENDDGVRDFVDTFHFGADRAASLDRYLASDFAADVVDTVRHFFGARTDIAICEVGAGNGFLAAALVRAGYANVDVLEPATQRITGTGYLRSLPEFANIGFFDDLDAWYAAPRLYDLIVTNACIHHFDNPTVVAAQIRLKVKEDARWFAFVEFFSSDYEDTLSQLNSHRHAVLYGLYEWPYSAGLYRAMLRAAGFSRLSVSIPIPYGRRAVSPLRTAWRLGWRVLCAVHLSGPTHTLAEIVTSRLARGYLRFLDPHFMAFAARPVRWALVDEGFSAQ
jgi:SAM-dependent methyltransferase